MTDDEPQLCPRPASSFLQLLEAVGLLAPVLDSAHRVRTAGLYDGAARRAGLRLTDLAEDFSFLAVLRQDVLEGLLEEALAAEGVKVQWNHQVATLLPEADHVLATVDRIDKESMGYSKAVIAMRSDTSRRRLTK